MSASAEAHFMLNNSPYRSTHTTLTLDLGGGTEEPSPFRGAGYEQRDREPAVR